MRDDVHSLKAKIQDLETKLSTSQSSVMEVSTERDSLRDMITKKEQEMQGEDQATMDEMKKLLEEVTARVNSSNSDGPQLSGTDLLRQFAETTERSAENLAKRAEVSPHKISLPKFAFLRICSHQKIPMGWWYTAFLVWQKDPSLCASPLYQSPNSLGPGQNSPFYIIQAVPEVDHS